MKHVFQSLSLVIILIYTFSGFASGRFIVKFKSDTPKVKLTKLKVLFSADDVEKISTSCHCFLVTKDAAVSASYIASIESYSFVEYAEEDQLLELTSLPDDPKFEKQWGLDSDISIRATEAWDLFTGTKDVIIGVMDTGVNAHHPDLRNNMWINEAERNGREGVDDDNNGYVDDVHGYHFGMRRADPTDWHGHGTHVAGILGAESNNGKFISGVNWNVSIMALAIFNRKFRGYLSMAIQAIDYAIDKNVHILQNSWGVNRGSQALKEAIERSRDAGILFVVAAGNRSNNIDDSRFIPATYEVDNIIAVASVNKWGGLSRFSNYGAERVHLAAPGERILSLFGGRGTKTLDGTSMAAPFVSGVAALVWGRNPTWNYQEVKQQLLNSVTPLESLTRKTVSGGMLNAHGAMTKAY